MNRTRGLRRDGSAALDLSYVACGRLDGFWELHLHPWDVAAGFLLVEEAGGRVSDLAGNPPARSGAQTVASNGRIHEAMLDVLRFWFDRGVDGFRIDVLWHIVKHADFPDNPANADWREGDPHHLAVHQLRSTDQPEALDIACEMRALADDYGARVLVGEIYLPVDRLVAYYGAPERPGVHLPFNFRLIGAEWNATTIARAAQSLAKDFQPLTDMRASQEYRLRVARNLLQRFHADLTQNGRSNSVWSYVR